MMKLNKSTIIIFLVIVVLAAGYRLFPDRALGFAPQIAIALFAGAVIKNRAWAVIVPILSMFLSDLLFQFCYVMGWTNLAGIYAGQFTNYVLFAGIAFLGYFLRNLKPIRIAAGSLIAPTVYFLLSNLAVWMTTGGYARPKTWEGLLMTYADGLPFYQGSLVATVFFSVVLFGGFFVIRSIKGAGKEVISEVSVVQVKK